MRKMAHKTAPGTTKTSTVRTTMKAPFAGRLKMRGSKRGGRGR